MQDETATYELSYSDYSLSYPMTLVLSRIEDGVDYTKKIKNITGKGTLRIEQLPAGTYTSKLVFDVPKNCEAIIEMPDFEVCRKKTMFFSVLTHLDELDICTSNRKVEVKIEGVEEGDGDIYLMKDGSTKSKKKIEWPTDGIIEFEDIENGSYELSFEPSEGSCAEGESVKFTVNWFPQTVDLLSNNVSTITSKTGCADQNSVGFTFVLNSTSMKNFEEAKKYYELVDEKGKVYKSEVASFSQTGYLYVNNVPSGKYKVRFYLQAEDCDHLITNYSGGIRMPDKTTYVYGSNDEIVVTGSGIPTPTMGSRNYTVTNKCTEPNGGIDCSVYKWTDDVFTVQIYSVDEDENETLVLDDVKPDRIDEYNDVKTAIFMIHKLAGGTYKFKVSDACGVVIDYNFTVRDEIQPDPVLTYEVTPYSCKKSDSKEDAKDGSITINVENYGYNSTLSKVVGEDSEILSYTTRESDGSVIFNLTELGTSDNFTLKLQNTCFTEDKEFEINMKEEAQKNGLFYLKSAEVKANAECTADNRRINFVVKGGQPSYSYQVIDKNTGNVAYTLDAYSASNTTSILPEGEYKFVASDANGCTDEISEGLDITTKHTLTAKKQAVCGDYIHVDLDYTGSLLSAGVHLTSYKSNSTTKKVTFDENSGDKYFFYEGDCDWMTGTFSSDYCQGFALLEEEEEKPLNIGYGRLPEIVPVSCLNSEGGSYTYYPRSQMSLRGYKLVLVATNKTSGKSYKSNEANNAGTALSVNELPAGEYEAYLALTYEDCIVESSKMALDDFTIEDASTTSIKVEEIKCSGKVFSTVHFGNVESVFVYDKEGNETSLPAYRGVTSSVVEGSFERAYLTLINGCEQNATLDKTDETDDLLATFKKISVKDVQKTEQSACDETAINDGSLTITLESTLENPAYSYSIILTDDKGKVINQIDDITDFTQPFVFNALAPGTYKGHLAVKVGDCLLEDEVSLFSKEIALNTETVAVKRLTLGKAVEDVCKGVASIPFTVAGSTSAAAVKVMNGEKEIESIAIAEDGAYSTSALAPGSYKLIYTASNEKGCIEKDEEPFGITTPTLNLPLYRSLVNASNANCMDNGKIVIEYGFYTRNSANDYECAIYPFYAKVTDVNSPEKEYKSDVQPASSDGKQWVNTKGTITFDNLPAGKYNVQFYYVTEGCDVMATFPASDVQCREYDRFGGHTQQIPYSYIVNNTIPINIYAPDFSNLDVKLEKPSVVHPTCTTPEEAGITIDYSGFDTKVAKLRLTAIEKTEAEEKQSFEVFATANEGTLSLSEMPLGAYDVKVQLLGIDGCELENGILYEDVITFKQTGVPSLVKASLSPSSPTCVKSPNGGASITINNWNEKSTVSLYAGEELVWSAKAIGEGTPNGTTGLLQKGSDATENTENGLMTISTVDLTVSGLVGGAYTIVVEDQCASKQSQDFELSPISDPFFIVQTAKTDLDCASSTDGQISVSLSGGSPENAKITATSEDGELLGSGRDITLTDLKPGNYNFKYVSIVENCTDEVNFPVAVTAPDPINFTYTAEDVICADKGASVTFKVENATGTPALTLYNAEG
ncbi:MAG: hypothetical protein KBT32_09395, partial [Bacteroidales bacterium]|nr:hypothetical protein [Candidatus Physcocola equi]